MTKADLTTLNDPDRNMQFINSLVGDLHCAAHGDVDYLQFPGNHVSTTLLPGRYSICSRLCWKYLVTIWRLQRLPNAFRATLEHIQLLQCPTVTMNIISSLRVSEERNWRT